jgi:hypothetical protein
MQVFVNLNFSGPDNTDFGSSVAASPDRKRIVSNELISITF